MDVHIVAPNDRPQSHDELRLLGFKIIDLSFDRRSIGILSNLKLVFQYRKIIKELKPNIILASTFKCIVLALIANVVSFPRRNRPKFYALVTGLGMAFEQETLRARVARLFIRAGFKILGHSMTGIAFQNRASLQAFKESGLLSEIPNVKLIRGSGVCVKKFGFQEMPKGRWNIGFIGRITREKGALIFLEMAELAKLRKLDWEFTIAGPFDESDRSVKPSQVQRLHDLGTIRYVGTVNGSSEILKRMHILVLPSYHEGLPKVILEAMACGRPVVASDIPGCREVVVPGFSGNLISGWDAESYLNAIARLLENPQKLLEMGNNARASVEESFSVSKIANQYREFLSLP